MTPRKPPMHDILPECARDMATITQQLKEVTKDQLQMAETIYGNSKIGLREQTEANIRDIASNTKMIAEMIEIRKLETIAREAETKARQAETLQREAETEVRKNDARKWWRGQAASVITTILAVIQGVAIVWILTHLPK